MKRPPNKKSSTQWLMVAGAVASLLALYLYSTRKPPEESGGPAQPLPEVPGYGGGGAPSGSFTPSAQAATAATPGEQLPGPITVRKPPNGWPIHAPKDPGNTTTTKGYRDERGIFERVGRVKGYRDERGVFERVGQPTEATEATPHPKTFHPV